MEKLLTPEDKKVLNLISNYIRSNGLREGQIEIDMDYGDLDIERIKNVTIFSNSYNVEIPEELIEICYKILKHIDENQGLDVDVDDLNYEKLEMEIDTIQKSITASHFISYFEQSEPDYTEWTEDDYKDLDENPITQMFSDLESDSSITPHEGQLQLRYNGSGDSGYLEDYFESGGAAPASVSDWCYQQLESLHGGWEINEGSQGYFIFDLKNKTVELSHTMNNEESETKTLYEEKF
jgi:hypothetical protein